MAGQRIRSTHGAWSIPYVDDHRLVFSPASQRIDVALAALVALAQIASCAVLAMQGSAGGAPAGVVPLEAAAHVGVALGAVLLLWAAPLAGRFSRIHVVRRRLEIVRASSPEIVHVGGTVDGLSIAPTARRALVHAAALGQKRLLVRLGDGVYELWRSPAYAGGGVPTSPNGAWVSETLSGGEGSSPSGAAERGVGMLLPVEGSLRRVLAIGPDGEMKIATADAPAARLGLIVLAAVVGVLTFRIGLWLGGGAPARAAIDTATRGALGGALGLTLVGVECLVGWAYLRATMVPALNELADAVLAQTAAAGTENPHR